MSKLQIKNKQFKKILVIQTAFLGDVILSTSLPKGLREIYPDCIIDIVLIPQAAGVYANNPDINKLWLFDKKGQLNKVPSFIKLIKGLRNEQYDLAISLKISLTASFIMLLSGIQFRLGYPRQKLLTHTVQIPKGIPVYRRSFELLKALTERVPTPETVMFSSVKEQERIDTILKDYQAPGYTLICIAPCSIRRTKQWLADYFSDLLRLLYNDYIQAVLIGSKAEREACREIIDNSGVPAFNLAGELNLTESAALIARLPLLISNDSAPLHIANAVKTDVIALFGPTVKEFGFLPYRSNDIVLEVPLSCRPCGTHGGNRCPEKHFRCMKDIHPELVRETILKRLQGKGIHNE